MEYNFRYMEHRRALKIKKVRSEDAGIYTVRMQYGNINITANITLEVEGRVAPTQVEKNARCIS